jgi:hypothetical protein
MTRVGAVIAGLVFVPSVMTACAATGCPAALLSGQLVEVDGALAVQAPNGELTALDWSNYWIRREGDELLVTDFWNVIAREGDDVNLGGGHVGGDGAFKVCGQVEVVDA